MASKNFIKVALVALLTLTLVFCMVPMAFATETEADVTEAVTDTVTDAESAADTAADTAAESVADTAADTAVDTSVDTEADKAVEETEESGEETAADTTGATEETEENKGLSTGTIVSIVFTAVIVIGVAIYCIKNKEKVVTFFREVRSECKKIVWTPWKTVKKSTLIVVIVVVVFAVLIGALDLLFHRGIVSLGNLI